METANARKSCFEYLHQRFQYLFEADLIAEMCQSSQIKSHQSDELLIEIGDAISHMPLIISGAIKVMTEDENEHELLLYYLELGDTCAMTLNCCSKASKSTIRAITEEPSEILFIPVEKMEEWMVKYKSWRNFVLESYNTRLNEMLEAIDNLAFHDVEKRLYKYLQDKTMVSKKDTINVTQYQIAADLNSSRVVVSRLLKKLEADNKLEYSRNQIKLYNLFD